MLYKQKPKRTKAKRIIVVAIIFALLFLGVRSFEHKAAVFSKSYLPSFARRVTTEAVSGAVEKELQNYNIEYGDLVKISRSDDGTVKSVEGNTYAMNRLKAKVIRAAQDELVKIRHSAMYIPLGAFTGLTLISNYGPDIRMTYCLTGSIDARFQSSFESAGVNQTIHHIRLIVTSKIVTASVDYDKELTFDTDYEVAQSVIIGQIPTTYGGYYAPPLTFQAKY